MSRAYAGIMGSLAMTVITLRGLKNGAGLESTATTAMLGLGLFFLIGLVIGHFGAQCVDEAVRSKMERQLAEAESQAKP